MNLNFLSFGGREYNVAFALDISERKKAEKALRTSEANYRAIFNSANDAIFVHDITTGDVISINRKAEEMYGRSLDEFRDFSAEFLFSGEPGYTARDALQWIRRAAEGPPQLFEWLSKRKDGELFWVETNLRKAVIGGETRLLAIVRDISERKKAEEEVRQSEQKYHSLFNSIEEGFILCGAICDESGQPVDFRLLETNPAFEKMVGAPPGQLAGRSMREAIPGLDDLWDQTCARVIRTGESERITRYVKEIGRWFEISAFAQGKNTLALLFSDVTERKEAEEKTSELLGQLQAIFDHTPFGIAYLDADFRFLSANRSFGELFSFPAEELIGRPCYETVGEYVGAEARQGLAKVCSFCKKDECIRTKKPTIIERPQGDRMLTVHTVPELNEEGEIIRFLEIAEDITARKRLEESRREMEAELQRSNRELEQFAFIVSHDLREPLRTISSFLNLVRKRARGQLDPEANEFIGYAVDSADRLDRMIQDLLEYSRIQRQEITLAPMPLFDIWLEAIENLRFSIEETGAHITHDPLPVVRGDANQLVRLLQNLIGNAITYCKDRRPEIHLGVAPEGERWRIGVQDNGIGIKAEDQERIFQIFERLHTRKEYPGTGVGLAICRKIVERHGGRIWVESEPGRGATFFFTLPKG
jgi:PAS domain S-box-containing protein